MSVRLQFPRGSAFTFTRRFEVAGAPLDLTSATLAGHLLANPDDDTADALATITVAALVAAQGTVTASLTAAATASLSRSVEHWFRLSATISGTKHIPENCQGPVVLTPLDPVLAQYLRTDGITDTLTPEQSLELDAASGASVINRPDITALTGGLTTTLDGIVTASSTLYPVGTVVILSYGLVSQIWKLVAGTDAEDVNATPAVVRPDDYHASTNAVVWKQIG